MVANVSALAIPDTEENWQASLNVDLMHTVRLVRAAMPHLERSDAASIIAISSVSGRESDFASGPYGTAKTAIVGYIHGLALQLADKGIRANTVSPGNTYFEGGVWAEHRDRQPGPLRDRGGPQPDRPHGHSGGDRRTGGLPGQPRGQPGQRHQPRRRRRADPRRPALIALQVLIYRAARCGGDQVRDNSTRLLSGRRFGPADAQLAPIALLLGSADSPPATSREASVTVQRCPLPTIQRQAFAFAHSTPHSVVDSGQERPFQAETAHRAAGADGFGCLKLNEGPGLHCRSGRTAQGRDRRKLHIVANSRRVS